MHTTIYMRRYLGNTFEIRVTYIFQMKWFKDQDGYILMINSFSKTAIEEATQFHNYLLQYTKYNNNVPLILLSTCGKLGKF